MHKCDICNKTNENEEEDDKLLYGEWMIKQNLTVHYYCLLLSTNLPQRGGDSSGILGFLLRDIRQEAAAAQKRQCAFCKQPGASIVCFQCRICFHMACGLENRCVFQFCDAFRSYCEKCAPLDDYRRQLLAQPPRHAQCDICFRAIQPFRLHNVTYGDCCRKGFAHRVCMRRYALASGYYLRCLWCREKSFHDTIRLQSVFVPDRDATWERQPQAYSELHSKHLRCEQETCRCPSGREYNRYSWPIQLCVLCAATGSHRKCRTSAGASATDEFKCGLCVEVERKLQHVQQTERTQAATDGCGGIDASFYLRKEYRELSIVADDDSPVLSDEESTSASLDGAMVTMVLSQPKTQQSASPAVPVPVTPAAGCDPDQSIIELHETQPNPSWTLRPPLLLHESFTSGPHFYLVVYECNGDAGTGSADMCTGTCTLRLAADDARLGDRSEQTLQELPVTEADIWFRDSNRGIYDKIDQYTSN